VDANLAAKLSTPKVGLYAGKNIEVVKKLASLEGARAVKIFSTSPTHSEPSVEDQPLCNWQRKEYRLLLRKLLAMRLQKKNL